MGRYLIECGYRKLGYVGTKHNVADAASSRLDGFTKAIEDGGGQVKREFCLHDTAAYYPGFYGTEHLLSATRDVECIYYQNDAMAFGGFQYCTSVGLKVPEDIGIAGWGDLPISAVLLASLSGEPVASTHDIGFRLIPGTTVRVTP